MSNKKKSLFSSSGGAVAVGIPLIMEVNTQDVSSADSPADSIILPFDEGNTVNLQIDWGDGSALEPYTNTNNICSHQYSIGGFYDIKIYNLNGVSRIPWNISIVATDRRDYSKFYDLKQFGDCEIYQLNSTGDRRSFFNCRNLDITATDIGERCVELCINAFEIFRECDIVEAKNSANWNTSGITGFSGMFSTVTNIVIDCSNWEMSQAENIQQIFTNCGNLNPDVTNWDISINCKSLLASFQSLSNFERNLSNWDVSGVLTMQNTFLSCTSFTGQGLDTWVTSALTNLQSTFQSCTSLTTVNLSSWDVSGVTTMFYTFRSCTNFVGNGLENWATTSALTNLQETFNSCTNFNADLSNWDVSGVTTMLSTFRSCTNFVGNGLENWTTTSLTKLTLTFSSCLGLTDVNLSSWDLSGVNTLDRTFNSCRNFQGNGLDSWVTTSALTTLSQTFRSCTSLTTVNLSSWDVSGVTTMFYTFRGCTNFVGNGLDSWVTSSLTNLEFAFQSATSFNQDLSGWDFSNATNMSNWGLNWGMDTNNYDKLLLSFASQTLQPNLTNVVMSSKYTAGEVTNGVTDSIATNKLIDSTQNFTSTVNVGDVIKNGTTYAEVVTVDSNTELTLDADIMALGDSYSVEGSNVAKARYFVVKTYNWQIIDDGQAPDGFILTFNVTNGTGNILTLPYLLNGIYDGVIYWGDGTSSINNFLNKSHQYTQNGLYKVVITGKVEGWDFSETPQNNFSLVEINKWGRGFKIVNSDCFNGCFNLDIKAVDELILASEDSLLRTFKGNANLIWNNSVELINTSICNTAFSLFDGCNNFNQDLSSWDFSNVIELPATFRNATIFNNLLPLNFINSNTQNIRFCFNNSTNFNKDISIFNYSGLNSGNSLNGFMEGKNENNYDAVFYDELLKKWDKDILEGGLQSISIGINMGGIKYTSIGAISRQSLINKSKSITDGGQI